MLGEDVILELVVREASVVTMIMLDGDAMGFRELFEALFCSHSLFSGRCLLQVYIAEVAIMVNKNSGYPIP